MTVMPHNHSHSNTDFEIKRQKAIEQEPGCVLIRINPDKEEFDIFKAINEMFRQNNCLIN